MYQTALFTIIQNETYFLNLWINYYSKHFNPSNIFILNHDSTNTETINILNNFKGNVIPIHNPESFNHTWLLNTVKSFQNFLLNSYTSTLFTECDEIIAPAPEIYPNGLSDYLNNHHNDQPRKCNGYNVKHIVTEEESLDLNQMPILKQRKYWERDIQYCKPLLANRPINWIGGFHDEKDSNLEMDPNLFLIHLHKMDYNLCYNKHKEQAQRNWSKNDLNNNLGAQNRLYEDVAKFHKWFYHNDINNNENITVNYIMPDWIQELI